MAYSIAFIRQQSLGWASMALVNACVMLRPNNFDPPVIFFPKVTLSKILTPSFSHIAVRCGSPTLRQVVCTWTCCGGWLAPRRANEGYTAEPPAPARLLCQAYHSCPGSTTCRPHCLDSLTPDASRAGPLHPRPPRFAASQCLECCAGVIDPNADHCAPA